MVSDTSLKSIDNAEATTITSQDGPTSTEKVASLSPPASTNAEQPSTTALAKVSPAWAIASSPPRSVQSQAPALAPKLRSKARSVPAFSAPSASSLTSPAASDALSKSSSSTSKRLWSTWRLALSVLTSRASKSARAGPSVVRGLSKSTISRTRSSVSSSTATVSRDSAGG